MILERKYSLAILLSSSACAAGATSTPSVPHAASAAFPSSYAHPGKHLFPESIAYDPQTKDFYVGGLVDGTIVRGNAGSSAAARIVLPPGAGGRASVAGIKIDRQKRLWVAGGEAGKLFVHELSSLKALASLAVGNGEKSESSTTSRSPMMAKHTSPTPRTRPSTMGEQPMLEEWAVDPAAVAYSGAYNRQWSARNQRATLRKCRATSACSGCQRVAELGTRSRVPKASASFLRTTDSDF